MAHRSQYQRKRWNSVANAAYTLDFFADTAVPAMRDSALGAGPASTAPSCKRYLHRNTASHLRTVEDRGGVATATDASVAHVRAFRPPHQVALSGPVCAFSVGASRVSSGV